MNSKKAKGEIEFPYEEKCGSVMVKIHRVTNKKDKEGKKRQSFMVSYFTKGERKQKMFADVEGKNSAKAFARATAETLNRGARALVPASHARQLACAFEMASSPCRAATHEFSPAS